MYHVMNRGDRREDIVQDDECQRRSEHVSASQNLCRLS